MCSRRRREKSRSSRVEREKRGIMLENEGKGK